MVKVTFNILEEFLMYLYMLEPELIDDKITFKQKDKRVFKVVVCRMTALLKMKYKKPFFLSGYIKLLAVIMHETKAVDIIKKVEKLKESDTGDTGKGVKKTDFIRSHLNTFWKQWLMFQWIPEDVFLSSIGFVEFDEILARFRDNQLIDRANTISALLVAVSSLFTKDAYEKEMKSIEKERKELEELTLDKQGYLKAIVGGA